MSKLFHMMWILAKVARFKSPEVQNKGYLYHFLFLCIIPFSWSVRDRRFQTFRTNGNNDTA